MAAITKSRPRTTKTVKYDMRPLAANENVKKGGLAMVVTAAGARKGYYAHANAGETGTVVGFFAEDADNTGGAAGALSVNVEFFHERFLELLDNDTGAPVDNTLRETVAFVLDDHTVTTTSGNAAGVVYEVTPDATGVWVEGRKTATAE